MFPSVEEGKRKPYIVIAHLMMIGARVFAVLFIFLGLLDLISYFRFPEEKMLHLTGLIITLISVVIFFGFSMIAKKMRNSIANNGTTWN